MFENLPGLNVLDFFSLSIDCHKLKSKSKLLNKKYLLKSFGSILGEEDFAKAYLAWDESALYFIFDIDRPFIKASHENKRSDCVEIFIDTRSLKSRGYITRFCHHFVFYAQEIKGYKGYEVTRFSADDVHQLCDPKELIVDSLIKPKSYMLNIEIPSSCLVGCNPKETNYFSFTYRINRFEGESQHFAVRALEHNIEKSPHLWPKFLLKN